MITYGATYCHRLWTFLGGLELLSRLATWNYWRSQHDRYWRDKQHAPMRSVGIAIIAVFYCGVMHAHFQGSTDATFYMVPVAWSVFLSFYNGQHEGSRTSACYVQIGPLGLCLSFFLGGTSTAVQGHTTYKSYMDYTYLNSTYCTLARRSCTSDGAARTLQTLTGTARYASINAHKGGPKMDGFGVRDEGWGTRWRFHRFLVCCCRVPGGGKNIYISMIFLWI